ncbi:response regulator transcription factor [Herpetosiphon giganteus]|uniref:response regulator transcription factor n=1 Tax=Herpetosiphon giganteus TaxID=2029754 RepID=UPI00195BAD50|nr:helix-turn-helix transcriptional regulator [Herpetosiphon giganteus]MBM7844812.1 DNA-binding NarL/FixJ family response regulator [Herpetosiphon giganteus]
MSTQKRPLSTSEQRIMQLLIQGQTNKAIAMALNLTTGSVETSLHRIYVKLGVENRVRAALVYLQLANAGQPLPAHENGSRI